MKKDETYSPIHEKNKSPYIFSPKKLFETSRNGESSRYRKLTMEVNGIYNI
jgi:hypothetical protein